MNTEKIFTSLPTLETQRLILREMSFDDSGDVFEYSRDPEVFRYNGGNIHRSQEDSREYIESIYTRSLDREGITWGIEYKAQGRLIGDCGLINFHKQNPRAEVTYLLSRAYWNKGLMSEVVRELVRFGFEEMQLVRIQAMCEPENIASARVAEKAGMTFEGVLRNYIMKYNEPVDMKMYSIIREEWAG